MNDQQKRIDEIENLTYDYFKLYLTGSSFNGVGDYWGLFHTIDLLRLLMNKGTNREQQLCEEYLLNCDAFNKSSTGFSYAHIAMFIYDFNDKISDSLKKSLLSYLLKCSNELFEQNFDFIGVNDNFPSQDLLNAYLTFKFTENEEFYKIAYRRTKQFYERLLRTTDSSEYNSTTYLPISMMAFAFLVKATTDDVEMNKMCIYCLDTLIKTTLMRIHKNLDGAICGPMGRAYTVDSVGAIHQMNYIYYVLLGDELMPSLKDTVFNPEYFNNGNVIHGDMPYYIINCYRLTRNPFFVFEKTLNDFKKAEYPYVWKGTAEISSSADARLTPLTDDNISHPNSIYYTDDVFEYPASVANLYTYMAPNYSIGSADREFHNGVQSESFMYTGKSDNGQRANIYARMITGDKVPGWYRFPLLSDEGRKICYQDENTAVCAYHLKDVSYEINHPAPLSDAIKQENIKSIKLSLIIYNHFNVVDQIICKDSNIYLRIGSQYIMFAPINNDYLISVDYETKNRFLMINFNNKIDQEKNNYRRGRMLNLNGFVYEVRDVANYIDIESFIMDIKQYELSDQIYANMHTRMTTMRKTIYENNRVHIEFAGSVISEGIFYKEIYKKI